MFKKVTENNKIQVSGNQIVDGLENALRLQGVNLCGLEWLIHDENIERSVTEALDNWNCNVIRIPLNQDFWFGYGEGQNDSGVSYRETFDRVLKEAVKRNKYVIMDLHWSDQGIWGQQYGQQKMPDQNSITFWQSVCFIYGNNPNIFFGIYNEPHDITWNEWRNGGVIEDHGIKFYAPGHQQLIEIIRDTGAKNICIVGGLEWAYDLTGIQNGYALADRNTAGTLSGNGIVYDAHIYPFKYDFDHFVACIKNDHPLLIGECGWFDPQWYRDKIDPEWHAEPHASWCPKLLTWIKKNNFHWTAWSFHVNADPNLLSDWNYTPTPEWGAYAKTALLSSPLK